MAVAYRAPQAIDGVTVEIIPAVHDGVLSYWTSFNGSPHSFFRDASSAASDIVHGHVTPVVKVASRWVQFNSAGRIPRELDQWQSFDRTPWDYSAGEKDTD